VWWERGWWHELFGATLLFVVMAAQEAKARDAARAKAAAKAEAAAAGGGVGAAALAAAVARPGRPGGKESASA
jgi:hypothetical protein